MSRKLLLKLSALPLVLACAAGSSAQTHSPDSASVKHVDVEARLLELGLTLPEVPPSVANYVRTVQTGNLVFTAGHGPLRHDGTYLTGRLGEDLDVEQGYAAARLAALGLLSSLRAEIHDLNRVRRIVKVTGMVNSTPDFIDQSKVVNGCSDLLVDVFGEAGRHARAAVGMASLPRGFAVEIEMIVEIEESPDGSR